LDGISLITCRDILNLKLDGVDLVAGEAGLDRIVSWTYIVQTRPFSDHMNQGNFALIVVDDLRFGFDEVFEAMEELNALGISGLGVSVVDDRELIPSQIIALANRLSLPLFYIRWKGASFVDVAQSIGSLIHDVDVRNSRTGSYLYNLLFGYDINSKYIDKISGQFGLDFSRPYRVGIIVVDRKYGINLEQDEHTYMHYANCLNSEVMSMEGRPMFLRFLNKFVLLFEARADKTIEKEVEKMLQRLDSSDLFKDSIKSTCILGSPYTDPGKFGLSYQEAKSLIPKKDILPNPKKKKVLSASSMGIYKYMFKSDNQSEILDYCNERLKRLEDYDHANGTFLQETLLTYYMHGFNLRKTSEALYIHRNSLQYRLKKIEELLEMELNDYMEYLNLVNCILVKRLMFS
jgi:sugar diacid utilization regulator